MFYHFIKKYFFSFYMTVISIGLLGNLLNIVVFAHKTMYNKTTMRLLFYLSIVDFLILSICGMDPILKYLFDFEIRLEYALGCKIHVFLTYFLSHSSSIILMIVSIERTFVIYSIKLRIFNIKTISKFIILVILFIGVINIHYFFRFSLNLIQPVKYSFPDSSKNNINSNKQKLGDLHEKDFSAFVRNGQNIIENLAGKTTQDKIKKDKNITSLIKKALRFNNASKGIGYSLPIYVCYPLNNDIYVEFLNNIFNWIDNSIYSFIPSIIMIVCSIAIIHYIRKYSNSLTNQHCVINQQAEQRRKKRNNQLLIMLVSTNISFMLFSLPYSIFNNVAFKMHYDVSFIANMISYSNNSLNFMFYCLFSTCYRVRLKEMFHYLKCLVNNIFNRCKKCSQSRERQVIEININIEVRQSVNNLDTESARQFTMRIDQFEFVDD